jgi:hypothetical protein
MLKKIMIGLIVVLAIFAVVVAMQPADFRVTRSATIAAPASVVFEQVNDFHKWEAWSPWAKMDPNMKATYSGPPAGTGASYAWSGNSKVGEGRMTITESVPSQLIKINLEFLKPMKATNPTEFTFQPSGDQTNVTWTMSGRNGFISKAFCLFMNMDKMVGGDFEKGLAQIKMIAEGAPKS